MLTPERAQELADSMTESLIWGTAQDPTGKRHHSRQVDLDVVSVRVSNMLQRFIGVAQMDLVESVSGGPMSDTVDVVQAMMSEAAGRAIEALLGVEH